LHKVRGCPLIFQNMRDTSRTYCRIWHRELVTSLIVFSLIVNSEFTSLFDYLTISLLD
jgi:hypothetical protein